MGSSGGGDEGQLTDEAAGATGQDDDWAPVDATALVRWRRQFDVVALPAEGGVKTVEGTAAAHLLMSLGAPRDTLKHIWDLADVNCSGALTWEEFATACYLTERAARGRPPPLTRDGIVSRVIQAGRVETALGRECGEGSGKLGAARMLELERGTAVNNVTPSDRADMGDDDSTQIAESRGGVEEAATTNAIATAPDPLKPSLHPSGTANTVAVKPASYVHLSSSVAATTSDRLHAYARMRREALQMQVAAVAAAKRAAEDAACTFSPEITSYARGIIRSPAQKLENRARGIVVAKDIKRWKAAAEVKHAEDAECTFTHSPTGVSREPSFGPETLGRGNRATEVVEARLARLRADRDARIDQLRAEILKSQTNGFKPVRATSSVTPGLSKEIGKDDGEGDGAGSGERTDEGMRERSVKPLHERLAAEAKGAPFRDPGAYADHEAALAAMRIGPTAYPSTPRTGETSGRRVRLTHHVETRRCERKQQTAEEASAAPSINDAKKQPTPSYLSTGSREAYARRARVLLEAAVGPSLKRAASSSSEHARQHLLAIAVISRSEAAGVLRAVRLLPSAPVTRTAQHQEARLVYRLCAATIAVGGTATDGQPSDGGLDSAMPLWLFCRFVGAATESGLERAGQGSKDAQDAARAVGRIARGGIDASPGAAFDVGRSCHAARAAWWPLGAGVMAEEELREVFSLITGPKAVHSRLTYTMLRHRRESAEANEREDGGGGTIETPLTPSVRRPASAPNCGASGGGESGGVGEVKAGETVAERLFRWRAKAEAAIVAKRAEADAAWVSECTFSPQIGRAPRMVEPRSSKPEPALSTSERRERAELAACTFKPVVNSPKPLAKPTQTVSLPPESVPQEPTQRKPWDPPPRKQAPPPPPTPHEVKIATRDARQANHFEKTVSRMLRAHEARRECAEADVLVCRAMGAASPSVDSRNGGGKARARKSVGGMPVKKLNLIHSPAPSTRGDGPAALPAFIGDENEFLDGKIEVGTPRRGSLPDMPESSPRTEVVLTQSSPARPLPGTALLTLDLGIGARGKKRGTLRFRVGDNTKAVVAKFVDEYRLPQSALPDVAAVLDEALQQYVHNAAQDW